MLGWQLFWDRGRGTEVVVKGIERGHGLDWTVVKVVAGPLFGLGNRPMGLVVWWWGSPSTLCLAFLTF